MRCRFRIGCVGGGRPPSKTATFCWPNSTASPPPSRPHSPEIHQRPAPPARCRTCRHDSQGEARQASSGPASHTRDDKADSKASESPAGRLTCSTGARGRIRTDDVPTTSRNATVQQVPARPVWLLTSAGSSVACCPDMRRYGRGTTRRMTGLPERAHRTCTTSRFVPEPIKLLLGACRACDVRSADAPGTACSLHESAVCSQRPTWLLSGRLVGDLDRSQRAGDRLGGSTVARTPQRQDCHAPAQQRSQRVQLAGRQLR